MIHTLDRARTLSKSRAMIAFGISNPPDPRPLMRPLTTPQQIPNQTQESPNPNQPQESPNPNQPQESPNPM